MFLFGWKRDVLKNVARNGWHCVLVAGDEDEPSFAYTVGLWEKLKTPELITFGLPTELMAYMLDEAVAQIGAGARLQDGARWPDLIEGFDCVSRPVHTDHIPSEYLNIALWYRQRKTGTHEGLQAYQLCWPSKADGRFPWEEGCAQSVRDHQVPLYAARAPVAA